MSKIVNHMTVLCSAKLLSRSIPLLSFWLFLQASKGFASVEQSMPHGLVISEVTETTVNQ